MWSAQGFPFSQLSQRLLLWEGRRNQYDQTYLCETEEPSQGRFRVPETRRYPIEDATHARDALARSSGKPEHRRGGDGSTENVSGDRDRELTRAEEHGTDQFSDMKQSW